MIPVVISPYRRSPSISFNPTFADIHGCTVLDLLITHLRLSRDIGKLFILHPEYPQEVDEVLLPLELVHTRHQSRLLGLCDAAQQLNVEHIAVVELPYLLAPPDLLDRSIRWHLRCGNSYTVTAGIPRSSSPIIYDAQFLKQLTLLKLPEASDDPFRIAEMIRSIEAFTLHPASSGSIRNRPLVASKIYSFSPHDIPTDISFAEPEQIIALRKVIRSATPHKAGLLGAFKTVLIPVPPSVESACSRTYSQRASKVTVLYLSAASAYSGAEESLVQLVRSHTGDNCAQTALVAFEGDLRDKLVKAGCLTTVAGSDLSRRTVASVNHLKQALNTHRPHIVHCNGHIGPHMACALSLLEIPYVSHVRSPNISNSREELENAASIICVSHFARNLVLQLNVDPARVHEIRHQATQFPFRVRTFLTSGEFWGSTGP